jgi:tetratricopeptide (TPR) repeat protein
MLVDMIITLDKINEKKVALDLLRALCKIADTFEHYDQIAQSYFKIKEHETALQYAELALKSAPQHGLYSAKYNVINVANHANYPERAMTLIKQLEIINPGDLDVRLEKAFSFFLLNQKDKAEEILRAELENPKHDEDVKTKIRFNLGTYELLRDEFQSGLRKFLFEGRKLEYWKKPEFKFERWEGDPQPGRKIYVRAEAGIGDEIINVRFMKHLRDIGMDPVWFSERKDMASIFNRCGFPTITSEEEIDLSCNPTWVHSMDLPVYLNLEYPDLWYGPYISASKEAIKNAKSLISKDKTKPKIGLRWQGNKGYDQDLHRSIPLEHLYNSVKHIDAEFYSLQRDDGVEELETFEHPIVDLSTSLTDFEKTLGIIESLDLVITSCTSIGHAAASMGKDVVIITPISAYYTWCHIAKQSPWYGDNLTLLRQQRPREWHEPLSELKEILDARFNH